MQKAKFKYHLKNDDIIHTIEGLSSYDEDKNQLTFQEDETDVLIDLNNLILTRDNKEMRLILDFKKSIGNMYMKELEKSVELPLKIDNVKLENNIFSVKYTLSFESKFEFIIKWTLGGE